MDRHDLAEELRQLREQYAALERRHEEAISLFQLDQNSSFVIDDRRRIAEDFHDRVIQRIFASSLMLYALKGRLDAGDQVTGDELVPVMAELDQATKEARSSIYTLTHPEQATGETVLHETASRAGLILGTMPVVTVVGDLGDIPDDLMPELATVLRESLTNTAKHASAHEVLVNVDIGYDSVTMTVEDDGVGMPAELTRSSGVTNLTRRAERRGGSATWSAREPSGTRLVWTALLAEPS